MPLGLKLCESTLLRYHTNLLVCDQRSHSKRTIDRLAKLTIMSGRCDDSTKKSYIGSKDFLAAEQS